MLLDTVRINKSDCYFWTPKSLLVCNVCLQRVDNLIIFRYSNTCSRCDSDNLHQDEQKNINILLITY